MCLAQTCLSCSSRVRLRHDRWFCLHAPVSFVRLGAGSVIVRSVSHRIYLSLGFVCKMRNLFVPAMINTMLAIAVFSVPVVTLYRFVGPDRRFQFWKQL